MLYKDDVPFKVTDSMVEEVYKFMGWSKKHKPRPAVIKFPESIYRFDRNNNRKVRPLRVNIPLEMTNFVDGEGSVKWNYTESPAREVDKMMVYPRKSKPMTGTFSVGVEKIDLLWFLIKSKYRANMPDEPYRVQASKPLFKVEMKEKEAEAKLAKDKLQTQIKAYINGDVNTAWTIEKIRKYALAFGVEEAEEMGPNEVKMTLLGRINGEPDGYERFEKLTNSNDETEIIYIVKKAINQDKIRFTKTRKWVFVEKGKDGQEICGIRIRLTAEESLVEFLKEDNVMRGEIANLVEDVANESE